MNLESFEGLFARLQGSGWLGCNLEKVCVCGGGGYV
jgi:hypothetical protein